MGPPVKGLIRVGADFVRPPYQSAFAAVLLLGWRNWTSISNSPSVTSSMSSRPVSFEINPLCCWLINIFHQVCHPSLRIAWFKRLGMVEQSNARTLFEHVYKEYEKIYHTSTPGQHTKLSSTPPASDSFLSSLVGDDGMDAYTEVQEKSELERYLDLGQGGLGVADKPLEWWKVSYIFLWQYLPLRGSFSMSSRCMSGTSQ